MTGRLPSTGLSPVSPVLCTHPTPVLGLWVYEFTFQVGGAPPGTGLPGS